MNVSPLQVGQYTIPPGNMIMPSLTAIMKDPNQWKDGMKFDPSRFIDGSGRVIKDERIIPFSTGKRQCPGESLAKAELFLFFVGMLQKYKFEPNDPNNLPEVEMLNGVTNSPKPYKVKMTKLC